MVHINRVRPLLIDDSDGQGATSEWSPPMFNHESDPSTITDVCSDDSSNLDEDVSVSDSRLLPETSAPAVLTMTSNQAYHILRSRHALDELSNLLKGMELESQGGGV